MKQLSSTPAQHNVQSDSGFNAITYGLGANESYGYTEDEIVSSDIIGIQFGSLFDATQTKVMTVGEQQLVKTVSWYDNEMSYVSQLVRTVHFFCRIDF